MDVWPLIRVLTALGRHAQFWCLVLANKRGRRRPVAESDKAWFGADDHGLKLHGSSVKQWKIM